MKFAFIAVENKKVKKFRRGLKWQKITLAIYLYDMKKQRASNERAKVGSLIVCPFCEAGFIKKTYQQVFCSNAKIGVINCKDSYWNFIRGFKNYKVKEYIKQNTTKQTEKIEIKKAPKFAVRKIVF